MVVPILFLSAILDIIGRFPVCIFLRQVKPKTIVIALNRDMYFFRIDFCDNRIVPVRDRIEMHEYRKGDMFRDFGYLKWYLPIFLTTQNHYQ